MSLLQRSTIYFGHWKTLIVGALAVAFGFYGINLLWVIRDPLSPAGGVLAGAVAGFIVHEAAHREAARRQGCIAGFVLTGLGLGITLLSGLLRSVGIPFAILAPGYVSIICQSARFWEPIYRRDDVIAAAGPATNIVLAYLAEIAASLLDPRYYGFAMGFAEINAWLALFNLLPFEPLDGSKIMRSNTLLWIILLLASILAAY